MKIKIILVIWFIFSINIVNAKVIKVAILDNPLAKWTSEKYTQYYLNGLTIAQIEAKKIGIDYKIQVFSYKDPAINIFKAIDDIKKWQPDIIIGPCASEQFLLLKDQFRNILILSPYASATNIYKLPDNFYTLAISSEFSAKKTFEYIRKFYPKHIYIFTDLECKSCIDFNDVLHEEFVKNNIVTINISFINSNLSLNQINYSAIFNNYNPSGDIVVLNCTGYGAGILMANISNTVKKRVIYIGGDSWGTYKDWAVAKIETPYQYLALRITPKVVNKNNVSVKNFTNSYIRQYKEDPDTISYVTYNLLVSVTESLQKYNCNLMNVTTNILCSYKKAVLNNPQWYRSVVHEVYQVNKTNEVFITDIK